MKGSLAFYDFFLVAELFFLQLPFIIEVLTRYLIYENRTSHYAVVSLLENENEYVIAATELPESTCTKFTIFALYQANQILDGINNAWNHKLTLYFWIVVKIFSMATKTLILSEFNRFPYLSSVLSMAWKPKIYIVITDYSLDLFLPILIPVLNYFRFNQCIRAGSATFDPFLNTELPIILIILPHSLLTLGFIAYCHLENQSSTSMKRSIIIAIISLAFLMDLIGFTVCLIITIKMIPGSKEVDLAFVNYMVYKLVFAIFHLIICIMNYYYFQKPIRTRVLQNTVIPIPFPNAIT